MEFREKNGSKVATWLSTDGFAVTDGMNVVEKMPDFFGWGINGRIKTSPRGGCPSRCRTYLR